MADSTPGRRFGHAKGSNGHVDNGKGQRMAWKGQWGVSSDGRSRISRLARRIEVELGQVYDVGLPRVARLIKKAAEYEAYEAMTVDLIGVDPKATPRQAGRLAESAQICLAQLDALGVKRPK